MNSQTLWKRWITDLLLLGFTVAVGLTCHFMSRPTGSKLTPQIAGFDPWATASPRKLQGSDWPTGVVVSPDGAKVAKSEQLNPGERITVGNRPGPTFDSVAKPVFIADVDNVAYAAMVRTQKGIFFDHGRGPVFSADGKKIGYLAFEKGQPAFIVIADLGAGDFAGEEWRLAAANESRKIYELQLAGKGLLAEGEQRIPEVGDQWPIVEGAVAPELLLNSDGSKIAYRIDTKNTQLVGLGNQKGPVYDRIGPLSFGPDGHTLIYVAAKDRRTYIVAGDEITPAENQLDPELLRNELRAVVLSADGNRRAYIFRQFTLFNGKKGPELSSPVAGKVAYKIDTKDRQYVVAGYHKGPDYERIGPLSFGPDGNTLMYVAERDGRSFIVEADRIRPAENELPQELLHGQLTAIVLSPDRSRRAYSFTQFVLLDGQRGEVFGYFGQSVTRDGRLYYGGISNLVFSPDGNQIAYVARSGLDKLCVVAGNERGLQFDAVWPPVFSPDGKKVAYGARLRGDFWRIVVDVPQTGQSKEQP